MKSNLVSKIAKRMKLTYYHLPWMKLISSEALKHYKFTISQVCEITYVRYYLVVKVCCHFFVTLEWEYWVCWIELIVLGVVIIFVKVKQFGWVVYYNFILTRTAKPYINICCSLIIFCGVYLRLCTQIFHYIIHIVWIHLIYYLLWTRQITLMNEHLIFPFLINIDHTRINGLSWFSRCGKYLKEGRFDLSTYYFIYFFGAYLSILLWRWRRNNI
jgi:hypothetical protein